MICNECTIPILWTTATPSMMMCFLLFMPYTPSMRPFDAAFGHLVDGHSMICPFPLCVPTGFVHLTLCAETEYKSYSLCHGVYAIECMTHFRRLSALSLSVSLQCLLVDDGVECGSFVQRCFGRVLWCTLFRCPIGSYSNLLCGGHPSFI